MFHIFFSKGLRSHVAAVCGSVTLLSVIRIWRRSFNNLRIFHIANRICQLWYRFVEKSLCFKQHSYHSARNIYFAVNFVIVKDGMKKKNKIMRFLLCLQMIKRIEAVLIYLFACVTWISGIEFVFYAWLFGTDLQ